MPSFRADDGAHVTDRAELAVPLDDVLHVDPFLIPADDARADVEPLERQHRLAEPQHRPARDRPPSATQHRPDEPHPPDQLDAGDVHETHVAPGIEMKVEIAIVRQRREPHHRLIERPDPRPEPALDHGEKKPEEKEHATRNRSAGIRLPGGCAAEPSSRAG